MIANLANFCTDDSGNENHRMAKKNSRRKRVPKRSSREVRESLSATEAQNNFGEVLQRVSGDEIVYITKYDRPTAVVMSADRYQELLGEDSELEQLEQQFDEMLAQMQTGEAAAAADALFETDSDELGATAVRAAETAAAQNDD